MNFLTFQILFSRTQLGKSIQFKEDLFSKMHLKTIKIFFQNMKHKNYHNLKIKIFLLKTQGSFDIAEKKLNIF